MCTSHCRCHCHCLSVCLSVSRHHCCPAVLPAAVGSASTGSARLWLKTYPGSERTSRRSPCRTWRTSWRASENTRTRSERRPWDRCEEGRHFGKSLQDVRPAQSLFDFFFFFFMCVSLGTAAQNLQQCGGQADQHGPLHQACVLPERTDTSPQQPDDRRRHRRWRGRRWRGESSWVCEWKPPRWRSIPDSRVNLFLSLLRLMWKV